MYLVKLSFYVHVWNSVSHPKALLFRKFLLHEYAFYQKSLCPTPASIRYGFSSEDHSVSEFFLPHQIPLTRKAEVLHLYLFYMVVLPPPLWICQHLCTVNQPLLGNFMIKYKSGVKQVWSLFRHKNVTFDKIDGEDIHAFHPLLQFILSWCCNRVNVFIFTVVVLDGPSVKYLWSNEIRDKTLRLLWWNLIFWW